MSDPNSPRAEWSDQEREFNPNGDDNNEGEELADPFAEFGGFDLAPDENENPGRLPVLYKARPPTPSEASDVDTKTKALFEELLAITSANSKFASFDRDRVLFTAEILTQNDILTIEAFRTTDETARRYLFEDLRKNDKLAFSELSCLLKLARHIPPSDQKVFSF